VVQCVVWIVHDFAKQLVVTLLRQLGKFREDGDDDGEGGTTC